VMNNPTRGLLDLKGDRLVYGGDTDIAFTGCRMGLGKAVFARLRVIHLIPAHRCTTSYLSRVAEGRGYSEVIHHLAINGVLPPPQRFGVANIVRYIRLATKPALQRTIATAHLRGRRLALRQLGAPDKDR
jgi:hypothetical protein